MWNTTRQGRKLIWLALVLPWVAGWLACAQPATDDDSPPPQVEAESSEAEESTPDVYIIRGQIAALPNADDPQGSLAIHHEAIDDFKGVGGEVWGMDSMTMPFVVSKDLSLEGFAVDDKIQFTLTIDWFGDPPQLVTAIEKLPADTELDFRQAQPADTDADEGEGEGEGTNEDDDPGEGEDTGEDEVVVN